MHLSSQSQLITLASGTTFLLAATFCQLLIALGNRRECCPLSKAFAMCSLALSIPMYLCFRLSYGTLLSGPTSGVLCESRLGRRNDFIWPHLLTNMFNLASVMHSDALDLSYNVITNLSSTVWTASRISGRNYPSLAQTSVVPGQTSHVCHAVFSTFSTECGDNITSGENMEKWKVFGLLWTNGWTYAMYQNPS